MVNDAVANLIRFCEFFRDFQEPPFRDRRPEHLRWIPTRR
jgi:hypothetical protein